MAIASISLFLFEHEFGLTQQPFDPDDTWNQEQDRQLLPRMQALWNEAEAIWDRDQNLQPFHAFVSADYEAVFKALAKLRGRVETFLEWGSGLGVITIMASNLGFAAYGIEAESHLVDLARQLAKKYGPQARFATGNFVPDEYQVNPEHAEESFRTLLEMEAAYDELDMELRDFDLVYAYPWPDEHPLFHDVLRQCGSQQSLFLSYDVREGITLQRTEDLP